MPVSKEIVDAQLEALGDFHHFFTSKEIRFLPEVLTPGEVIAGITSGFYEGKTWIIVITNIRLVFLDKGFLYGLKQVDMPLAHVSSIAHKTGLMLGEIEVFTSSGSKTIGSITKKDVLKISSIIAGLLHSRGKPPASAPITAAPQADMTSQLERLGELHAKGVLTAEEFTAAKAKLIGH